jgi:hypothetical protein
VINIHNIVFEILFISIITPFMASDFLGKRILDELRSDSPLAIVILLVLCFLLYLNLYAFAKKQTWTFRFLSVVTLLALWESGSVAPVRCAAVKALFKFAGMFTTLLLSL